MKKQIYEIISEEINAHRVYATTIVSQLQNGKRTTLDIDEFGQLIVKNMVFNTALLKWQAAIVDVGSSGTVAVTNFPTVQPVSGLIDTQTPRKILLDTTSLAGVVFVGLAEPGSDENDAVWRIAKVVFSPFSLKYAGGSGTFTNIYANRLSLSYN